METECPRILNYEEYEHAFSHDSLKDFAEGRLRDFDTEKMRGLVYGYTFTEDYKKGIIPDTLSMDYWKEKEKDRFAKVNKNILHDAFSALSLSEYLGQGVLTTMAFVRDLYFPVFDLLHFNSFWSEVHVAYQHFSSRVEW